MNADRGSERDRSRVTPGAQRQYRPGTGAGARKGKVEPNPATWALGFLWAAAIGIGLLLMQQGGSREPDEAERRALASGDLVSTRTQTSGGAAERPRERPQPRRPRSAPALGYTYRQVLRLNDRVPGGGRIEGHLEIHGLNDAGQVLVVSDDPRGEAMFLVAAGQVKPIVRPGRPGPDGVRYGSVIYMPEAMNNEGQVVWSGTVESGETWSFLYDARTGRTSVVQRPGRPAPGGGTFLRGERPCPVINNRGEVAFHAAVGSHESGEPAPGVFARFRGETVLVAREGTLAPDGGHFRAAEYPAINDRGEVVFHAVTSGSDGLGVYRWRDGSITAVAGPGTAVRGSRRLEHAFYPQTDGNGGVVFLGQTRRGTGLYRWVEGTVRPIVEPRGFLPGLGPMQEIEFNGRRPFDLNEAGAAAFIARGAAHTGVFVWEQGKVKLVAISDATLPPVGLATQVGTPFGQGDGYRPPGVPYGYAPPPGATAPGSSGPPGVPPRYYTPYGAPGRGYGTSGRSFGIGLSNDGKVAFLAAIERKPCLLLATPKPSPERPQVAQR